MEHVLLWASLATGVMLLLCRFLPRRGESGVATGSVSAVESDDAPHPVLRNVALFAPLAGLLLTLPATYGVVFHDGQRLGIGFLIGGVAVLAACADLLLPRRARNGADATVASPVIALTAFYGAGIVAVALALLFLRQSLHDALMGVAIGGFCSGFALLLGLSHAARQGETGRRIAAGLGMMAVLAAGAGLGVFRDPLTPELAKLTWSAVLLSFAAFGALLVVGTHLLPLERAGGQYGRMIPLMVLVGIGGLALYECAAKVTDTATLALPGIGGLLLWVVVLAVQREGRGNTIPATPTLSAPLLSVLLITSGFLAALQTLQGVGAAVGTLALFLAYPATLALSHAPRGGAATEPEPDQAARNGAVGLLLFATLLLLWRFFVTRWSGDLRGVNLADQYALFGLLVGAALPGLLAMLPARFKGGTVANGGAGVGALAACAVLVLASPAAVLVLFGAKSAVALLIGLAVGAIPLLSGGASLLPGLLAVGIALALDQFAGRILPAETLTRADKMRYLAFILSAVVVAVIAANRVGSGETATISGDAKGMGAAE